MANPSEIEMSLMCRLCLAKDRKQVTIPIFEDHGDIRQIFLKISSCLPIKITKEDQLPKNICDGCSDKLDLLYEFWNTSLNSEKTLLFWLAQAGLKDDDDPTIGAHQQIVKPVETLVKEEIGVAPNLDLPQDEASEPEEEPEAEEPPKKRARRTAAVKAQIQITPESEDDDDDEDNVMMDEPESVDADAIAKLEEDSEESDGEEKVPPYADVPGTSAQDQPGTSGLGKDGAEAPLQTSIIKSEEKPKSKTAKRQLVRHVDHIENQAKFLHQAKKIFCQFCNFTTQDYYEYERHMMQPPTKHAFVCACCSHEFPLIKGLMRHVVKHHNDYAYSICDSQTSVKNPEIGYQCHYCPAKSSTLSSYVAHKKIGHNGWYFTCPVCKFKFVNPSTLFQHFQTTHALVNNVDLHCESCDYHFYCPTAYKGHMSQVHKQLPKNLRFHCVLCSDVSASLEEFCSHVHHHRAYKTNDANFAFEENGRPTFSVSSMQCHLCAKVIKDNLDEHLKNAHELCTICNVNVPFNSLFNHMLKHHQPKNHNKKKKNRKSAPPRTANVAGIKVCYDGSYWKKI